MSAPDHFPLYLEVYTGGSATYPRGDVRAHCACAIALHHRRIGNAPLSRPELAIEVARLCGEERPVDDLVEMKLEAYGKGQETGLRQGKIDMLDTLEEWAKDPHANQGMPAVRGWIAAQRKAVPT